ncbi:MAG: D-alanine--D-alanine ligase [Gammaproteobacteria bacterium]|nr:D-alanine--D-alanine ligase [Gammaproteobacteria bacterium]
MKPDQAQSQQARPLNVAVLKGGRSAEAEVSRKSADQVVAALRAKQHTATAIELDLNCAAMLIALKPDVVFPALHGPEGEDGTAQGFLELLGFSYVGSGVHGSAVAMDKSVAKSLFQRNGLPVAEDIIVTPAQNTAKELDRVVEEVLTTLGPAVVIKPLSQGSAIGVTPLPNGGNIAEALSNALQFGTCMVEAFVVGKEITVGVLEVGQTLVPHPVIEIITASGQWYDYENRYTLGSSEHVIPARLEPCVIDKLQQIALVAHRILDLRDLSRADFIVSDSGEITLLEVNTLPGMTPTSLYPDGAKYLGYDFPTLIDHLVRQAYQRNN